MEIIRGSDQEKIKVADILAYRVSGFQNTDKPAPITWHKWGDPNCVANHFGLKYEEFNQARLTDEWADFAKQWAKDNNIEYRYVKQASLQPRGGISKSEYEAIGRSVVGTLENKSQTTESQEEEHETTLEWVEEQMPALLAAAGDFMPDTRPVKPKKTASVQTKIDEAVEETMSEAKKTAIDRGLSEEDIAAIFGE